MGSSVGGRDLEIPLWAGTRSRHELDIAHRLVSRRVATWFWCRDTDLMSRHDFGSLDVATSK